ncbi:hypothetical protein GCM10009117_19410 [Gangjinia marincola]|uniref:Uncharacterized protein n=1 Tax=Gangjinia marincola TaxID=578463 RepID=A0ABN1MI49_9FLAO
MVTIFSAGCATQNKFVAQDKSPFQFGEAYYHEWTAGIQGGGSGINLFIPASSEKDNLKLHGVYFQNQMVVLQQDTREPGLYVGRFRTDKNPIGKDQADMIMDIDPAKEAQNEVPQKNEDFPFDLTKSEAVVSYKVDQKMHYIKLDKIKKMPNMDMPMIAPNGGNDSKQ